MKILIVGLGSIGQRHLRNLAQLGVDHFVALRTGRSPLPPTLPDCRIVEVTELDRALAEKPSAALVCNPTSLHLPIARALAEVGCHLFIEKPLSHSLEGLDDLTGLVRERNLVGLVGYNLRFHPALQLVRRIVEERWIGRIVSVQAQVGQYLPDWHPWEDYRQGYSARCDLGGGVLLDLSHDLDYLRWLVGDVAEVACLMGRVSNLAIETEDVAVVALRFVNGAIGHVQLDYLQRVPSRTCRLVGEVGTVLWDAGLDEVRVFTIKRGEWQVFRPGSEDRNETFLAEMRHFLACLEGSEAPLIDLGDGAATLRVALSARDAAETGQTRRVAAAGQLSDTPTGHVLTPSTL